jgi:hypothetical protein
MICYNATEDQLWQIHLGSCIYKKGHHHEILKMLARKLQIKRFWHKRESMFACKVFHKAMAEISS